VAARRDSTLARLVVLGSVNTDLVIRGPRLPSPGETVLGGMFYEALGGKGANKAVAAARASREPVALVAAVGDDAYGERALAAFAAEDMIVDYVKVVPGRTSGVALILVDARGENLISVASGANLDLSPDDVAALPADLFTAGGVFVTCLESPLETVRAGLIRAKRAGMTTILNPAPACTEILADGTLRSVDVLTPNEGEAAMLAGCEVNTTEQLVAAGRRLQQMGPPQIVITLGRAGCLVVDREITAIPAESVDAIDSTGAGDAFNGALAVALLEGKPLVEAARWAAKAAAISVTRAGAQPSLPKRTEIEGFGSRTAGTEGSS